jgi:formimidoylglutamate deiminase
MGAGSAVKSLLRFRHILTPDGIERHKRIGIDGLGRIVSVTDEPGDVFDGWLALPGMPNAHSHSFQRGLVGSGETAQGEDSFWSWREAMYRLAQNITPDDIRSIAAQAFADMLRAGFTSVAEFHYLHHLPDNSPGPEMARAVIDAAEIAGIRLVMLPVFYQNGGFGQPPEPHQGRFVHQQMEDYLRLLESLRDVPLGLAPHSVRAVAPSQIAELDAAARGIMGDSFPRHIHISEQRTEVEQCVEAMKMTPIQALADSVNLDQNWNLVHATHATKDELELMLETQVTAVLCPLTEAYLGDGVFPATAFVSNGGITAIGSDSNVRIDAIEELRLLEYGQRLSLERRACLATSDGLGVPMWMRAAAGGAQALAQDVGAIRVGAWADFVVIDPSSPPLLGLEPQAALDALITAGSAKCIGAVLVGGRRLVEGGRHLADSAIARRFTLAQSRLREAS